MSALPRPSAVATRIDTAEAPRIDGDVADAVWDRAQAIDRFYQVEPVAGATPTERTEVRVLYDTHTLYIAIHCFDSEPDRIVATLKARDGFSPNDDFVRISLDPLMSRRSGYAFEVTPLGGRVDALTQNNTDLLTNWNIVWAARARITADGWSAEMAIPFRSLSFNPAASSWGFDVTRMIRRKSESMRWSPTPSNMNFTNISLSGTLEGLHGMQQGAGLDLQLYGLARYQHDWRAPSDNTTTFRPSANLFYKVTPALTATLTANPDFSDAPLDPRTVNTTRFSLFTPEVRPFFLQDAASFAFGGLAFTPDGARPVASPNGQPFFSRNLGLIGGFPVSIIGGGKLSGEFARLRIGALSVRTDDGQGVPGRWLSVARVATPVLASSTLGAIVTHGDPRGAGEPTLVGTDFQYLNTNLGHGKRLVADTFFERSLSTVNGNDNAFGTTVSLPNEPWGGEFDFKQIGEHFRPALGFVNRTGIRESDAQVVRRKRLGNSYLLWYEFGARQTYVTGLNGNLQSHTDLFWLGLDNRPGDTLNIYVQNNHEAIPASFVLPGNTAVVPAGRYDWVTVNPHLVTSKTRPLLMTLDLVCCRFYDGRNLSTDVQLEYRPNGTLDLALEHRMSLIRLPSGSVDIHIFMATTTVNLTADMQWITQLQHDSISDRFGVLSRYRWEYRPGQEIFAAISENALASGRPLDPDYRSDSSALLLRIGHTFQF